MPVENAGFLEQANGAVYRGNRDAGIDGGGAFMQLFDIGMVGAVRQDFCNDATLFGDPKAAFCAKSFDVDGLMHELTY